MGWEVIDARYFARVTRLFRVPRYAADMWRRFVAKSCGLHGAEGV